MMKSYIHNTASIPSQDTPQRRDSAVFVNLPCTKYLVLFALLLLTAMSDIATLPSMFAHAAAVDMNCTLIVPANPLTARGLATPYQLVATTPADGPCNEANPNQSAFVQGVVIDPATGKISIYEPLVIDKNTKPAIDPIVPSLPANAIVAIWFGFNGTNLMLAGDGAAQCVNGLPGSLFGQFAYCNASAFFQAANTAIQQGKLQIPTLGTGIDGQPCPTTRSFSIVDMDQSDNVQTQYLANANGQIAQFSAANQAMQPNAMTLSNPSDNALMTNFVDPALGCTPFTAPDLVNANTQVSALPLDELQAAKTEPVPVALVPLGDPMTLNNNQASLEKTNLYRVGVDQTTATTQASASTKTYCKNLIAIALPRLQLDQARFQGKPSPDGGATANSLFTFLANRLNTTMSAKGLNCVGRLHIQNPVTLAMDGNGVVTAATIHTTPDQTTTDAGSVQNTAEPQSTMQPTPTPTADQSSNKHKHKHTQEQQSDG